MGKKSVAPITRKTMTVNCESDCIGTAARDDCLILFSITRIAWKSNDEEERVRQRCRVLQTAVADAEALSCDEDDNIPLDPSWWPL